MLKIVKSFKDTGLCYANSIDLVLIKNYLCEELQNKIYMKG